MLVPQAADAHIGSADIDLCLSLAITGGATREYYRSIEEVLEPHFEPERASGFSISNNIACCSAFAVYSPAAAHACWTCVISRGVGV